MKTDWNRMELINQSNSFDFFKNLLGAGWRYTILDNFTAVAAQTAVFRTENTSHLQMQFGALIICFVTTVSTGCCRLLFLGRWCRLFGWLLGWNFTICRWFFLICWRFRWTFLFRLGWFPRCRIGAGIGAGGAGAAGFLGLHCWFGGGFLRTLRIGGAWIAARWGRRTFIAAAGTRIFRRTGLWKHLF